MILDKGVLYSARLEAMRAILTRSASEGHKIFPRLRFGVSIIGP